MDGGRGLRLAVKMFVRKKLKMREGKAAINGGIMKASKDPAADRR
jgi:hypothetical protein